MQVKNVKDADAQIRDGYIWTKQTCPICDSDPTQLIGKRGGQAHRENLGVECDIWRCANCDLVFPNPMPVPVGGLGQHYEVDADEYFQAHDKGARLDGATALVKKAEQLLGRKGKILDVGVGRGEVLVAATERGWECEGVEPSKSFADYAEKRTGAKIWREPIEDSQIPDGEYDVVILAAVLEHLYNPDEIIRKVSRTLKVGGIVFVDVPNEAGLYFRVGNAYQKMRGRNWSVNLAPTFAPFHVFGFSPQALRKLLNKHNLFPEVWNVYGGTSLVSSRGGLLGVVESAASKVVTQISNLGEMGTYIETWAIKREKL